MRPLPEPPARMVPSFFSARQRTCVSGAVKTTFPSPFDVTRKSFPSTPVATRRSPFGAKASAQTYACFGSKKSVPLPSFGSIR